MYNYTTDCVNREFTLRTSFQRALVTATITADTQASSLCLSVRSEVTDIVACIALHL